MIILEYIAGFLITLGMAYVAFMSSHIISEKKAGHSLPLPWEKGDKDGE